MISSCLLLRRCSITMGSIAEPAATPGWGLSFSMGQVHGIASFRERSDVSSSHPGAMVQFFRHRRPTVEQRSINDPHETRPYAAHGHMDVVTLGDFTLGRGTFEPGWQWSKDVKPIAGTESCMVRHTGICMSGKMTIRTNDGAEATVSAGDVFVLEPGHDAWTVGDEPCIMYDTGVAAYAKPAA
jgi:uncharacterized cupin superfamily protein